MYIDTIEENRKYMLNHNLVLMYEGELNQKILLSMVALLEKKLEAVDETNHIRKKLVNIIIEALQNVIKYEDRVEKGSETEKRENHPIFMLGKKENKYLLIWGNSIHKNKIDSIKEKLEYIGQLDREGLNDFYQEKVKDLVEEGLELERNSAGLGFIDITKKSGENIQYDFRNINEDYSYFYQTVGIQKPEITSKPEPIVETN